MITQPLIIPIKNDMYELVDDWSYEWDKDGKIYRICLYKGWTYDGASVPKLLWPFMPPDGIYRPAIALHDILYETKGKMGDHFFVQKNGSWVSSEYQWKRSESDKIMFRVMRELDVTRWRRRWAYRSVRVGGWWSWRSWE